MDDRYLAQTRLLIGVLPYVAQEDAFALKGGTAINLFHRDMPRLSVDIDLTYLKLEDRGASLRHIDETLDRIRSRISDRGPRYRTSRTSGGGNGDSRILVSDGLVQTKIETNPVIRGTVRPPVMMKTSDPVTEQFGFAEMRVLAVDDLYGGKLHAALDRQHPRDRVSMEELDGTRRRLHADVQERLTGGIAAFLLSLHDAEPDFDLIGFPHAEKLPAVRWKLLNLAKLKRENPKKHAAQRCALEALCR